MVLSRLPPKEAVPARLVLAPAACQPAPRPAAAAEASAAATTDEADGRGDLAYVVGRYRFAATPKGTGAPMQDEGKFVEIYRRQSDGGWKYPVDIHNADLPVK